MRKSLGILPIIVPTDFEITSSLKDITSYQDKTLLDYLLPIMKYRYENTPNLVFSKFFVLDIQRDSSRDTAFFGYCNGISIADSDILVLSFVLNLSNQYVVVIKLIDNSIKIRISIA